MSGDESVRNWKSDWRVLVEEVNEKWRGWGRMRLRKRYWKWEVVWARVVVSIRGNRVSGRVGFEWRMKRGENES